MDLGASILPRCTVRGDGTLPGQSWRPLPRQNSRTDLPARPSRQSTIAAIGTAHSHCTSSVDGVDLAGPAPSSPVPSSAERGRTGAQGDPPCTRTLAPLSARPHEDTQTDRQTPGQARQRKASFSMERTLKRPISARLRLNGPSISTGAHHGNLAAQRGQHARPMGPAACLSATWASGRRRAKACLSTKWVAPMAARVVCGTGYVAIRGIQCRIWRRSGVLQRLRRRHSSPCLTTTRAARAAQTAGTAQEYHHQQSHRQTPARQRHIRVASILGVGGRRRRSDASERLPGGPAQPSPVGVQWEGSGGRRGGV